MRSHGTTDFPTPCRGRVQHPRGHQLATVPGGGQRLSGEVRIRGFCGRERIVSTAGPGGGEVLSIRTLAVHLQVPAAAPEPDRLLSVKGREPADDLWLVKEVVWWAGIPSGALASRRSRCRATAGSGSGTSTSKTLCKTGAYHGQDVNISQARKPSGSSAPGLRRQGHHTRQQRPKSRSVAEVLNRRGYSGECFSGALRAAGSPIQVAQKLVPS
jgi:hypothetical protein